MTVHRITPTAPNCTFPTKAGGMFSNFKSQASGWIPSMPAMPAMPSMPTMPAMPSIPGLRKTGAGGAEDGSVIGADAMVEGDIVGGGGGVGGGIDTGIDDDERSSATEGADSRPASGPGTPSEEKAGQVGMVTTKVTQGAKTFGSFLYSAVNKAGAKIKETVKDNQNILGEFNKEQDAFMKAQGGADAPVAPWAGHHYEEKVKEEILGLSADRRNFVRAPPAGVEFEFNYDVSYPVAMAIMNEDAALEKMRFELVPKIITEEQFWRNYFYRVQLICQAGDLGTLTGQTDNELPTEQVQNETNSNTLSTKQKQVNNNNSHSIDEKKQRENKLSESEFVSDAFHVNDTDLQEVKQGMKRLGIDSLVDQAQENDDQWEKELAAELQDFEVVNDGNGKLSNTNWEKDVDDLLGDDLK